MDEVSESTKKRVRASVNGVPVAQYRAPKNDLYEYDIHWLLNEAPALLGEAGVSYSGVGSGNRVVADTSSFHARAVAAMPVVQKARRLTAIWDAIQPGERAILEVRYVQRRQWPFGFEPIFGELSGVVLYTAGNAGNLPDVKNAVSNTSKHRSLICQVRKDAEEITRQAHRAWRDAKLDLAMDVVCQPWSKRDQ